MAAAFASFGVHQPERQILRRQKGYSARFLSLRCRDRAGAREELKNRICVHGTRS